jgi:hypothetical protein
MSSTQITNTTKEIPSTPSTIVYDYEKQVTKMIRKEFKKVCKAIASNKDSTLTDEELFDKYVNILINDTGKSKSSVDGSKPKSAINIWSSIPEHNANIKKWCKDNPDENGKDARFFKGRAALWKNVSDEDKAKITQ